MNQTLSYVVVTPYTISKSRTGGVIARLLSRADLELVAAQIITPGEDFVRDYAANLRDQEKQKVNSAGNILAGYIERHMNPSGGRRHRILIMLFRGEDACKKLSDICGALFPENQSVESITGETIRDTYADFIVDINDPKKILHLEPAILTPRKPVLVNDTLALFARHFRNDDNIVRNMIYPASTKIEQTLVIIKPDNWNFASSRPGTIIDMFSRTGLRIVGMKIFRFSMNQALEFYGPVESSLKEKLGPVFGQRAKEILEKEFAFKLSETTEETIAACFGQEYAQEQFIKIVDFMSGRRPDTCPQDEADKPGNVKCMIIIYEGENAISKIRDVLGPTDPLKAPGGTVRREFGSNVMVNTAHASDSVDSCEREKKIVRINENQMVSIIDEYLAGGGD